MKCFDADKINEVFEDEKRQAVSGVAYAALSAAQNRINHLPDLGAGKRGQWIMRGIIPFCSECGERAPLKEARSGWNGYKKSKSCPECGAKMANYDR